MVLHVLLAYSGMNDRDFEQFEMGKKYLKRIKEVANDIVYNYYSDICDPNDLEIKWYYNNFKDDYKNKYEKLDDAIKALNKMNKLKFDLVIFLIDHANEIAPDLTVALELYTCNILKIPTGMILFDEIVKDVKEMENIKQPLIANPRR